MVVNNFLHLYLKRSPTPDEIATLLRIFGFSFIRKDSKTDSNEPVGYHWVWRSPHLSGAGAELVFYHRLFSDDKFYGQFNSFVMFSGNKDSTDIDLSAIDIFSNLLLRRYGGQVYNPEGEDTLHYLCGRSCV